MPTDEENEDIRNYREIVSNLLVGLKRNHDEGWMETLFYSQCGYCTALLCGHPDGLASADIDALERYYKRQIQGLRKRRKK